MLEIEFFTGGVFPATSINLHDCQQLITVQEAFNLKRVFTYPKKVTVEAFARHGGENQFAVDGKTV